jgi:hypothetical protein
MGRKYIGSNCVATHYENPLGMGCYVQPNI